MAGLQSSSAQTSPCIVIAASTRVDAEAYVRRSGLSARIVDRFDIAACRGRVGSLVDGRLDRVVLHTLDWRREHMPQLYLLALARSRVADVRLVDESAGGGERPLGAGERLAGALAVPGQALVAAARCAGEVARGRPRRPHRAPFPDRPPKTVVAVWPGAAETRVGGSVTHAAGILGAFGSLGLRVVLITEAEPPRQLLEVVDGVEVLPPLPASARLGRRIERLAGNRPVREVLERIIDESESAIVYARHQAMSTAAAEVASARGVPFVLEWNASERWAQEHWTRSSARVKGLVLPIVSRLEEGVVARATVIASVSAEATAMAEACGAHPDGLVTVPNGVDADAIGRLAAGVEQDGGDRPLVGWIGSFGEWHGAEVLVRAAARVASPARFLMIGDGTERAACERLAAELGVGEAIEFAGRLPHDDALRALARCDVLASPHVPLRTGEPFFGSPTKIYEYMALGRPIVASDLGQIGEVLEDRRSALLVEPGSVEGTAAAIDELLAAPDLRDALGAAARQDARRLHTWNDRAERILAALAAG